MDDIYIDDFSERKLVRQINLFVSVTDDSCFNKCDLRSRANEKEELNVCKNENCRHMDDRRVNVTITCLTCHKDEMTSHFWGKSKDKFSYNKYVEKIHNGGHHMFKYSVPPGLYEIKCR